MSRNRTALRTQKRKCQFASKGDPFSRPRICKYNFGRTWLIILDALFVRRRMQRQSREALFRAKHILKKSLKDFGKWVDHLLLELVTNPIFLIVSFFFLFAIIVKWARDREEKNAREKRERLKRRV
jgi:hypothetical protein